MRIFALTLNVDKLKESPGIKLPLDTFVYTNPSLDSSVDSSLPDYYVEFTQEDSRDLNAPALVGDTNTFGLPLLAQKSMNFHASPQNIITKIYSSRNSDPASIKEGKLRDYPTIRDGTIPLAIRDTMKHKVLLAAQRSSGFVTKGAVWIHIQYRTYSLLFVNIHLPVLTSTDKETGKLKDPTLGYDYRKESLVSILEELAPLVKKTTFTLIGGDLNFRIDPGNKDQLDRALLDISLVKEVPFPNNSSKTYTCKFKTIHESANVAHLESCRLRTINSVKNKGRQECHDEHRLPSRCDRFLYSGTEPHVEKQESIVYLPESDHNALYTSLVLNDRKYNAYGSKIINHNLFETASRGGKQTRKQKRRRLEKTRKHK